MWWWGITEVHSLVSYILGFGAVFFFSALQTSYRSGFKYKVPQWFQVFFFVLSFFPLYLQRQDTDSVTWVPSLIDLLTAEEKILTLNIRSYHICSIDTELMSQHTPYFLNRPLADLRTHANADICFFRFSKIFRVGYLSNPAIRLL